MAATVSAEPAHVPEERTKAAFLYRFLEYVEWPAGARMGPLTIAVLGDDRLVAELMRNVQGRTAHGRAIRAHAVRTVQEGLGADVLFVSQERKHELAGATRSDAHRPVLIVTEAAGALDRGSVINLLEVDGKMRFEVSLPAAERRGLKLSSRLLSVALRVETGLTPPA